jgi:hypothetical protein
MRATGSPRSRRPRITAITGRRLLLQGPGWQQVEAGLQLVVVQLGVGAAAAGPVGQAAWAHQHGNDALDPGERAVGAAADPQRSSAPSH